ncbi:uncharacterized protein LOC116246165 [Nymphaea colorata]|nr:uncharacterized protein LOC116246165 [Nymphaea colorata]
MSVVTSAFFILYPLRLMEPPRAMAYTTFRPTSNALFRASPTKSNKWIGYWLSGSGNFIFRVSCSKPRNNSSDEIHGMKDLQILKSWNVPWDWLTVVCIMLPYVLIIFFTGIMESAGLRGDLQLYSQRMNIVPENADELAAKLFIDQLLKTAVKLSIIYAFVRPYQPFPDDVFSYRWEKPFDLQHGWVVWGSLGLLVATSTIFLIKFFLSSAGQVQNEADPLLMLLPFIGTSNFSTACVLGTVGVLAPVCEETLYRGFLMVSLTKWFPVPLSVLLSAFTFALAHQSSGKFLEIFTFGVVLGLVYAQTRNLFSSIAIHACWNFGVILLLKLLQLQGYNIEEYTLTM